MPDETLKFRATLDGQQFTATISKMESQSKSSAAQIITAFSTTISALETVGAGLFRAFSAPIAAISDGTRQVFDYTHNLEELSDRTGIATGRLHDLARSFQAAGLEADDVGSAVNRMQKFLQESLNGEAANNDLLRKLHLNFLQLHQLAPEQQFATIGKAIANMRDPIAQGAASMEVFSRGGGRLLQVFKDPKFDAGGPLSDRAKMLAQNAEDFTQASIQLQRAGDVFKSFYTGVATEVAAPIVVALEALGKVDLSTYGREFGQELVLGSTAVVDMLIALKKADIVGTAEKFAKRLGTGAAILNIAASTPAPPIVSALAGGDAPGTLLVKQLLPFFKTTLGKIYDTDVALLDAAGELPDKLGDAAAQAFTNALNPPKPPAPPAAPPPKPVDKQFVNGGKPGPLEDMTSTGIEMRNRMGIDSAGTPDAVKKWGKAADGTPSAMTTGGLLGSSGGLNKDGGEAARQRLKGIREQIQYQNPLLSGGPLNEAVAQEDQRQKNQEKVTRFRDTYDKQHPAEATARQAALEKTQGATSADVKSVVTAVNNLGTKLDQLGIN